ncbi:hypothetical protein GCM10010387_57790 [Streptomyces inusitatus]|uniref:Uncharacterized protein n=1 Tax=Streptomyces inusitatus TaxID=68221 RepID=A0A918QN88_9ACTN|nr:hypothetical protein [Streptomyces inusitatus]GGZ56218.1 hypothetical protein GCM10010387_57790 [Streptomyces inusitatus]
MSTSTDEFLDLLRDRRSEIHAALTAEQFARYQDGVRALRAARDDVRAVREALRAVRTALRALPPGTELSGRLGQVRGAGPAGAAVLPDADRLDALIRLLESADWPALEPDAAEIARGVRERLLTAPARGADRLPAGAAGDPAGAGLIRLTDRAGHDRYPDFQFDPDTGEPLPVVQRINRLLLSDQDPWGAADWWLGGNEWLDDAPAALLGRISDEVLTLAARELMEEGAW